MTTVPFILLALLCCAMGCTATEFPEFHCMHDEVMKNSEAMPATIIEPGPDKSGVQGAAKTASNAGWKPIRFKVFSEDLNSASRYCTDEGQMRPTFMDPLNFSMCTEVDIFTADKKNQLLNDMIPSALKLHSERLLVQRLPGNIIVRKFTTGHCGAFTIPQSHDTTGVADADMVMYVAAGPTGSARAWAGPCTVMPNGRPVSGVMLLGPAIISNMDKSIRVVAHEIAHALGFVYEFMDWSRMVSSIPNIRGETRLVVTSSVTLSKAKAHYNCNSIAGMELENKGGSGTAGSHWERRNARDELMAGIAGVGYYTAMTMAAFEDQKYYRANWGKEETMEWGLNAGCPFLKEKCVNNGTTNYPDMFCTEMTSVSVCTFARKGLGRCALGNLKTPLPVEYQYFPDPKLGGTRGLLDYCPIVEQYSNTGCTDGNPNVMPGSRVGPKSVCLKGEGLRVSGHSDNAVQDICAEVSCTNNIVRVRYAGYKKWYRCPEGSTITPKGSFTSGKIVCPGHAEICDNKLYSGDDEIDETIDDEFDTQTTKGTSSHDMAKNPSDSMEAMPHDDDDLLSNGRMSTHDRKGNALPSKRHVDSSPYPNHWYRNFIPLCVSSVLFYVWLIIIMFDL